MNAIGIGYNLLPKMPFGGSLILATVLVVGILLGLRLYRGTRRFPHVDERLVIVGRSPLASRLIEEIETQTHLRYSILGVVDDAMPSEEPVRYPYLGPLGHLSKVIKAVRPHRIIIALAERRQRLPVNQLLAAQVCDGILVEDGVEAYERLTGKLAIEAIAPSSLIFDKTFRKSPLVLAAGHALSVVVSVVALVGLAPLFCLIALAIRLDSCGPVFFVHERVGAYGKPFKLIKFRTMRSVDRDQSLWSAENHNRITRVGRLLRKFRLDELPQFLNILKGDMNLVGPRPHRIAKFDLLGWVAQNISKNGEAIPYISLRSRVRPGITGWAQVRYHYAHNLEQEIEKLRYDLYYVKHMSPWFDLRILLETLKIVLLGRGSSEVPAPLVKVPEGGEKKNDEFGWPPESGHLPGDQDYAPSFMVSKPSS